MTGLLKDARSYRRLPPYLPHPPCALAPGRGTGNGILISTRAFAALPVERLGLEGAGSRKLVSKVEIWLPTFQLHGAAKTIHCRAMVSDHLRAGREEIVSAQDSVKPLCCSGNDRHFACESQCPRLL